MKELEEKKAREAEMKRREIQRMKEYAKVKKTESQKMQELMNNAYKRSAEYDQKEQMINGEGSGAASVTDNSKKAYFKEFKKVVDAADVILEVLDARDPLGCRCPHIEELILSSGHNKKIILVLNKIDLVPREITEQWVKYLKNEFPTVAFKSSTQNQKNNLSQSKVAVNIASDGVLNSSECLGADMLMKILKNYCRSADIKTAITVGVIGYPNAGKSSLINSLKRSKACGVGSTPGFTKIAQEVHIDKHVKLIDSPGIVFTSGNTDSDILLRNCVKVEQLQDPITPVNIILKRCRKDQLLEFYCIPDFKDVKSFLGHLALKRGKLARGGVPNVEMAARLVLQDWNSGKISFYTHPPERQAIMQSSVVSGWSEEFKLADIESEMKQVLDQASANETSGKTSFMTMSCGKAEKIAPEFLEEAMCDSDDEEEGMECDDMEEEYDIGEKDQDAMEDDSKIVNRKKKEMVVQMKKRVKFDLPKKKKIVDDEDLLNPQLNKNMKKMKKQQQRDVRRGFIASDAEIKAKLASWGENDSDNEMAVEDDDNDMYNFKTDYVEMEGAEQHGGDSSGYESL